MAKGYQKLGTVTRGRKRTKRQIMVDKTQHRTCNIQDLIHKIAEPTIEKQMENYLHRTNQTFERFLNNINIKHTIMHLYWNDKVCCENVENCSGIKTRPISRDKLDVYYQYGYKINSHCNVQNKTKHGQYQWLY
jgi:hypothetical protein